MLGHDMNHYRVEAFAQNGTLITAAALKAGHDLDAITDAALVGIGENRAYFKVFIVTKKDKRLIYNSEDGKR
jgi:hypothetical protein